MSKKAAPFYWAYRLRGTGMIPLIAVMLFCTWREIELDAVIFPLGGAIFLVGLAVRVWAQMHLHYRLEVRKHLTLAGPYRFVRNPIYISNIIILLGLTVMSELVWFIPVVLAYSLALYSMVVRHEEAHLTEKYGDAYRSFMAETPRWLPRMDAARAVATPVRQFFFPSIRVELYNFLFLLIPLIKEVVID